MLTKDECHAIAERVSRGYFPAEPRSGSDNIDIESSMAGAFHAALDERTCGKCQHSGAFIKWCDKDVTIPQVALNQRDPTFGCTLFEKAK